MTHALTVDVEHESGKKKWTTYTQQRSSKAL